MKKLLSLILTAAILLSLLPSTIFAADTRSVTEAAPFATETRAPINKDVFLSNVKGWPGYEFVFDTPAFSKNSQAVADFTNNQEMVSFLKSLLPTCANMYYFKLGSSPTYKLEFPLVVFTKTDLSNMTMEEAGAAVRANGKATVLHQAQIHGNEPAAGEGALSLATALAGGHLKDGNGGDILDTLNIMIIPRINPDGSKEFQRANTANGINMNRDYLVVKSSEVEMVLRAYNAFLPDVAIDAHEWTPNTMSGTGVFDDLQLWSAGSLNNDPAMLNTSIEMMETVFTAAEAQGIRPYFYQGNITFGAGSNSIGPWYYGLRGTYGFCVETRGIGIGWKNFARRVFSQYIASESFIQYTAAHAQELRANAQAERERIAKLGETYNDSDKLTLQHKSRTYSKSYRRPTVNVDANKITKPNATATPIIYDVAGRTRTRPTAYVLKAGTSRLSTVLSTLDKHGIRYIQLKEDKILPVQQYSGSGSSASLRSETSVTFKAGSYVFPMNQETGNILAMLMEPDVNDTASPSEALSTFVQKGTLSASSIYRYTGSLDVFSEKFRVSFCTEDGTVLHTVYVEKGKTAFYPDEAPTKAYTDACHYAFAGWINLDGSPAELDSITTHCNVYASFAEEKHTYTSQTSKEATCTQPGTLLYSCSGCAQTYEESVPTVPHSTELRGSKDATCTEAGYTGDEVCTRCGEVITSGTVLPPAGHTPVTVPGREATCLSSGLSDGENCGICGIPLIAQQILPRLGHSYEYTDLSDGTHSGVCTACGKTTTPEAHAYEGSNLCALCGAVSAPILDESIQIRHTLDLLSDISIHYVVDVASLAAYDSFYLTCELPRYDGTLLISYDTVVVQPTLRGSYYYFTLDGITAPQMGDTIRSVLYMKNESGSYCSSADLYSVSAYAYSQLSKDAPYALKVLCAELLRYGSAAQNYKEYRTDALVDASMTADQRAYLRDLDTVPFGDLNRVLDDREDPPVAWVGKALDLGSKVCVRLIIDPGTYPCDARDLTLHLSYTDRNNMTKTVILTDPSLYHQELPYYVFDFTDLLATELRAPLRAVVYHGQTQVSATLEYSADTYGNGKTGSLRTLCTTLFAYSDAARDYFATL